MMMMTMMMMMTTMIRQHRGTVPCMRHGGHIIIIITINYLLERLCRCGGGGVEPRGLARQEGHVGVRHR
jgi:hypothetical protein